MADQTDKPAEVPKVLYVPTNPFISEVTRYDLAVIVDKLNEIIEYLKQKEQKK